MNKLITTNDFFLTKYKIEENKEKIVYLIPSGIEIDFIGNREILLNKFNDVEIEINSKNYNKKITCFKKKNEHTIYLDS